MKKSKLVLLILSITYFILAIISIINSESKLYNILLLIIIYVPYLLIIVFSDGYFGKVISIGFCIIEIITSVLSIIGLFNALNKGSEFSVIDLLIRIEIMAYNALAIVCFVRLMKERDISIIKYIALGLLVIVIGYFGVSFFQTPSIPLVKITIFKNAVFYIILYSYLFFEYVRSKEIKS